MDDINMKTKVNYDEKTGEIIDGETGERFSAEYDLEEKFTTEVRPLVEALLIKCRELHLPLECHIAFTQKKSDGKINSRINHAVYFPSKRVPMQLRIASDVAQNKLPSEIMTALALASIFSK